MDQIFMLLASVFAGLCASSVVLLTVTLQSLYEAARKK